MRITSKNVEENLHRFNKIYPEHGPENPMPKNVPIIVFCSNGSTHRGWSAVKNPDELGLHALIAQSWVTQEEFKSWK